MLSLYLGRLWQSLFEGHLTSSHCYSLVNLFFKMKRQVPIYNQSSVKVQGSIYGVLYVPLHSTYTCIAFRHDL